MIRMGRRRPIPMSRPASTDVGLPTHEAESIKPSTPSTQPVVQEPLADVAENDFHEEMDVSDDEDAQASLPASSEHLNAQNVTSSVYLSVAPPEHHENAEGTAFHNLDELRKRVLASKEAIRSKGALSTPSASCSSRPVEVVISSSTAAELVYEGSQIRSFTPPSLTSGSSSSSVDEVQDFVSAFISDAIRSVPLSIIDGVKLSEPVLDVAEETSKKHIRLEQHIAESKNMMEQYAAATSKAMREQLMKVIKAKNRCVKTRSPQFRRVLLVRYSF